MQHSHPAPECGGLGGHHRSALWHPSSPAVCLPLPTAAHRSPCMFENVLAYLGFFRWTCLNTQLALMLGMVHGACRYRGPPEDVPDPNLQVS